MSRPRTVEGGRPVVVTTRVSEAEAAVLDRIGPTRSLALRSLIPKAAGSEPEIAAPGFEQAGPATRGTVTLRPVPEKSAPPQHEHRWRRHDVMNRLDTCACGAERAHEPGTR